MPLETAGTTQHTTIGLERTGVGSGLDASVSFERGAPPLGDCRVDDNNRCDKTETGMTKNTDNLEPPGTGGIVVGIDDSPSSHAAIDWAAKAARSSGDRVRAVHVLNDAGHGPVVLGVGSEDLVNNIAGMEFALHQARQLGVPVNVVHVYAPRHQLVHPDSWLDSEHAQHGRRVVGRVAQQLRRMSRFEVHVDVTNAGASGVDALLAASTSASVLVLQARACPNDSQVGPGSTIRAVAARAGCPVVVLHRGWAEGTGRGVVVGSRSTVVPRAPCGRPWSRLPGTA